MKELDAKLSRRNLLKGALVVGAATALPRLAAAQAPEPPTRTFGSLRVGTYISSGPLNHYCNTHWVETDEGVVIVDAQWTLPEARNALAAIRAETPKPVLALFITHEHSDHYGGLAAFVEALGADLPILSSRVTRDSIQHDFHGFIASRREAFGDDFSNPIPLPNRVVKDGERLELGGVTFEVLELRQNEAISTILLHLPDHGVLFTADVVNNETTPFLWQGGSEGWLDQLFALKVRYPDLQTIYPGHGVPGSAANLIDLEISYITTFQALVYDEVAKEGTMTPAGKERIRNQITAQFPGWRTTAGFEELSDLLDTNVDVLLREWRIGEDNA